VRDLGGPSIGIKQAIDQMDLISPEQGNADNMRDAT
jgi:hypothetical protein